MINITQLNSEVERKNYFSPDFFVGGQSKVTLYLLIMCNRLHPSFSLVKTSRSHYTIIIPTYLRWSIKVFPLVGLIQPAPIPRVTSFAITFNLLLWGLRQNNMLWGILTSISYLPTLCSVAPKSATVSRSHKGERPVTCLCWITATLGMGAWTRCKYPIRVLLLCFSDWT